MLFHSKELSFHSCKIPKIKIIRKKIIMYNLRLKVILPKDKRGRSKTTSTSKIRKIKVIKKNRIENVINVLLIGSTLHS